MIYFGTGHEIKSSREEFILVGLSAFFLLLGIFLIGSVLTSRLILTADSIELKYLVSSKLLRRSDIAGFRILPTQYIPTLVLEPKSAEQKKLKIPLYFRTDEAFADWFIDISNLDREDLQKSKAGLEAAAVAVDSPGMETSEARIGKARSVVKILNLAAGITPVWAWIYPNPYPLPILPVRALPFIATILLAPPPALSHIHTHPNP